MLEKGRRRLVRVVPFSPNHSDLESGDSVFLKGGQGEKPALIWWDMSMFARLFNGIYWRSKKKAQILGVSETEPGSEAFRANFGRTITWNQIKPEWRISHQDQVVWSKNNWKLLHRFTFLCFYFENASESPRYCQLDSSWITPLENIITWWNYHVQGRFWPDPMEREEHNRLSRNLD